MKHARTDYARIQDPAGLIPEDEPVFLIRGQDKAAPTVLRYWVQMARHLGAKDDILVLVEEQADAMEAWQKQWGGKTPDLPR
jgi:hypothetical protein